MATPTPTEVPMRDDVRERLIQTFQGLGLHPLTAIDLAESLAENHDAVMDLRMLTAEIILDQTPDSQ